MMESKAMRVSHTTLALTIALALGACGPVNRGLESVNQPVVQRTDYVFDVSSGGLSSYDERRLTDWFDALNLGYGDRVSIDSHSGDDSARSAIAAVVARYGLLLADTAPVTQGSDQASGVRVVVSRSNASVPNCPNWDRPSQPELAASTMSNHGCAVNSNLAAMMADPADLVQGRSIGGNDPLTINRAIKSYRDATNTGDGGLPGGITHDSVVKTTGGN
jgi:pilus assembly protein CpaD